MKTARFWVLWAGLLCLTLKPSVVASTPTYVVQKGDTLKSIATVYGITVADLKRANSQAGDGALKVGQQLVIPVAVATPAKKQQQATTVQKQTQDFFGTVETIDVRKNTITIKNYGKNETKTFNVSSESRFEATGNPHATLADFIKGGKVAIAYMECGDSLTAVKLMEVKSVPGVDDSYWGDGAENFMSCKVIGITGGGLVVEATASIMKLRMPASPLPMGSGDSYSSVGAFSSPSVTKEKPMNTKPFLAPETIGPRLIAVANHPKEKSLAEGDMFQATFRREGVVEGTDTKGNLRRLPRWVYVSDK